MEMLDGTFDGGGDGFDLDEIEHSGDADESQEQDDFEYLQQEDFKNDVDNFKSHELAMNIDFD